MYKYIIKIANGKIKTEGGGFNLEKGMQRKAIFFIIL